MKKFKKAMALLLALTMSVSIAACSGGGGGGNNVTPGGPDDPGPSDPGTTVTTPTGTVTEQPAHYVSDDLRLHKVNVTESNRVFIKDHTSEYKIVHNGTTECAQAANFIQAQLLNATGVELPVIDAAEEEDLETWTNTSKLIVLGVSDMCETAEVSLPADEDLGFGGYYIKTVGDSVFALTATQVGWQNVALSFLNHVVGYDIITYDLILFEKSGETLPDMEIIERPDFAFRATPNNMDAGTAYAMGFTARADMFCTDERSSVGWIHNVLSYMPKSSAEDERYSADWFAGGGQQLCYTAHGNEKAYNDMVEIMAQKVVEMAKFTPGRYLVSITQEDGGGNCTCNYCMEEAAKYGGAVSSLQCHLINKVDDRVRELIAADKENFPNGRELTIMFFAYSWSIAPPTYYDEATGEYIPYDQSVVLNDGVGVFFAPIFADFMHSMYEDENYPTYQQFDGWQPLTKKFYVWSYETNFGAYLYPYITHDTQVESMRFYKEMGADFMFSQGQYSQGANACTGFTDLKNYIDYRSQLDVNVDSNALIDRYFDEVFLDAAEPMREMYDRINLWTRYLENFDSALTAGGIYQTPTTTTYPKQLLEGYMDLLDEAQKIASKYAADDPTAYARIMKHIKQESIFPRWALLTLHTVSFSPEELQRERESFVADCHELGVISTAEGGSLATTFTEWGL